MNFFNKRKPINTKLSSNNLQDNLFKKNNLSIFNSFHNEYFNLDKKILLNTTISTTYLTDSAIFTLTTMKQNQETHLMILNSQYVFHCQIT